MRWSRSASCSGFSAVALAAGASVLWGGACKKPGPPAPVAGETLKLRTDEPRPERSALFDGTTIRLRGARGETLAMQVLAEARSAELELPEAAGVVEGFTVHTQEVREPSTALYGPSRGKGRYPDLLEPRPPASAVMGPAFFDVAIAASARPGRYEGRLVLDRRSIPVELLVEPVTIDLARDPLVWVFYLPREVAREHGVKDDDGLDELMWERRYVDLFRRHGCFLASDLGPKRFPPRSLFAAGLRYWPVAVDLTDDAHTAADVKQWLNQFSDGLTIPFAIPIDEPHSAKDFAKVAHIGEVIAQAGGGVPRFLRAVTAPRSPYYDSAVDVFISPRVFPGPAPPGKKYWTYNGRPPEAGNLIIDTDGAALRTWGWIAFRYDVELWYAWEGLYWSDRYNQGGPTHVLSEPITFDERRKGAAHGDHGNGDGVLVYPGPMPSLRLKALRRGLQDRLLLAKLARCGGGAEADALARRMVPRALGEGKGAASWPTDEPAWERARMELLDALVRRCPERTDADAAEPAAGGSAEPAR